jgi:hypothetical protein
MRYETITLGSNVIRFPVELRAKPSIDLLIEVAPESRAVELIAEAFGFDPPDPDGRSKADRAMAETIAKTALPADPKERQAALNAMLKPLVDRAVAACGEARQTALRSDEAGAKLASAQIEGGYWLAPREDAANHWAVESARLPPTRPRRRPMGPDGRSSSPSAPSPGVRPMSKKTSTPSSPRRGRSPASAALLPFGERASRRAASLKKEDTCSRRRLRP